MQWTDEGIILSARRHGETSAILEVLSRDRGRCVGLVRGGRSRRMRGLLQRGNRVSVTWRARLEEHLGHFQVEPVRMRAAGLMENRLLLFTVQLVCDHMCLMPERHGETEIFYCAERIIESQSPTPIALAVQMAFFEQTVLRSLGFGLDLSRCALTGTTDDLAYVSPRSGRAVDRQAAYPWVDKLLPLPEFLVNGAEKAPLKATRKQVVEGLALSRYFLHRYVYEPRRMQEPLSREMFLDAVLQSCC